MNSIRTLVASVIGTELAGKQSARSDVRRAPSCETLEGRQLLSGSRWAGAPPWYALSGTGTTDAAHIQPWNGAKDAGNHHFLFPGTDFQGKGDPGHPMPALSAQAKADLQTLHTDISKLQAEVPASLQAQIKADKTTIENALASLTLQQRREALPAPSTTPTTPPDPITVLTAELKAANASDTTINSIASDFKTYESTLKTIDPALTAQIKADQTALAKEMPAPTGQHAGHPNPMAGAPGVPVGPGFGF